MSSNNQIAPQYFELDLGDGHWLYWTEFSGERCGGIISHLKSEKLLEKQRSRAYAPDTVNRFCEGSFTIRGSKWNLEHPEQASWEITGTLDSPTLAPSFLCHCGDHGFVQNGKWVRA